jgi:hypothetical protein
MKKVVACFLLVLYLSSTAGTIWTFACWEESSCEAVQEFKYSNAALSHELTKECSDIHNKEHYGVTYKAKVPRANACSLIFTNCIFPQRTSYSRAIATSLPVVLYSPSKFIKNCVLII